MIIGGGFGGLLAGARLREARRHELPHHRSGRRLRRHLVLEPLSGRAVRHRVVLLPAAARRDSATCRRRSTRSRRRSSSTRSASANTSTCTTTRCFQTQRDRADAGTTTARAGSVSTNRDDAIKARFVVHGDGTANRPKLPGIPGIDDFEGHTFHTSRWDYDYTGGDHNGGLTKLADKRVAIIGTGATAIQCVPFVGEYAKQLYVFQRTPSSVDLRGNKPTDPEWVADAEAGLAARAARELRRDGHRPDRSTRTWSTTAGPTSSARIGMS